MTASEKDSLIQSHLDEIIKISGGKNLSFYVQLLIDESLITAFGIDSEILDMIRDFHKKRNENNRNKDY